VRELAILNCSSPLLCWRCVGFSFHAERPPNRGPSTRGLLVALQPSSGSAAQFRKREQSTHAVILQEGRHGDEMAQSLVQARQAARLRRYRVWTRLSEIQRRLKAQYEADTHAPISRRLKGLLDAIDRPQRGEVEPG